MRVLSLFFLVAAICLSAVSAVVLADRAPGSTPCLSYSEETTNADGVVFRQRIVPSNETIELRSIMPDTTHIPLNDTAYLTITTESAPQTTTYYLHRNQAAAPIPIFISNRSSRSASLTSTSDGRFGLLMLGFPVSGGGLSRRFIGFSTDGTAIHLLPETIKHNGLDYTLSVPSVSNKQRYGLMSATPITTNQPKRPTPYFVIYDLETFSFSSLYEFRRPERMVTAWSAQGIYLAAELNDPHRVAIIEPSQGEIASYPLDEQVTSPWLYWSNSGKALIVGDGEGQAQRLLGVLRADGHTLTINQSIQEIVGWSHDEQSLGVFLSTSSGNPLWQRIDLNTGTLHPIGDGSLLPQRVDRRIRNLQRSQGYIWAQQWHSASSYDLILIDPAGEREAYRIEARATSRSHLVEMIDPPAPITALIWQNQSLTLINSERGQIVSTLEDIHAFQAIHSVDGYIAFAAWRDGQQWIGIADPVRGVLKLVAPYTAPWYAEIESAQFSPDFTQVAVTSVVAYHGERRILTQIAAADGSVWTLHFWRVALDALPSVVWSPDKQHVLIQWRDFVDLPSAPVYQAYRYYNTATHAVEGEIRIPATTFFSRLLDGGWSACFYHYTPADFDRWARQ